MEKQATVLPTFSLNGNRPEQLAEQHRQTLALERQLNEAMRAMEKQATVLPTFSFNGNRPEQLAEQYRQALALARQLNEAMRAIDMHARNYKDGEWPAARQGYTDALSRSEECEDYLREHYYHCKKHVKT